MSTAWLLFFGEKLRIISLIISILYSNNCLMIVTPMDIGNMCSYVEAIIGLYLYYLRFDL